MGGSYDRCLRGTLSLHKHVMFDVEKEKTELAVAYLLQNSPTIEALKERIEQVKKSIQNKRDEIIHLEENRENMIKQLRIWEHLINEGQII